MTQKQTIVDFINRIAATADEALRKDLYHVVNMIYEIEETISIKVCPMSGQKLIDTPTNEMAFIHLFNEYSSIVHANAVNKGWWDVDPILAQILKDTADKYGLDSVEYKTLKDKIDRNAGESYMLMVSELAEALENDRAGNTPDSHLPEYPGNQVELVDAIIRVMDWGSAKGYNLGEILVAKARYNTKRPYKHGKKL